MEEHKPRSADETLLNELRCAAREGRVKIDSQLNNDGDGLHLQWIWDCVSYNAIQYALENALAAESSTFQGQSGWSVTGPPDSDPDIEFKCFVIRSGDEFTVTALMST